MSNFEKRTFFVVNDNSVYVVDTDDRDRLLWDMDTDKMMIGRSLAGETEDSFGYIDMLFQEVEEFDSKRDAMKRWCA